MIQKVLHETCQQYVARRLSEGWRITGRWKHLVFLSPLEGSFIRVVDLRNDVETLRPSGVGSETSILFTMPFGQPHWQMVDDTTPADDATTTVYVNLYDTYYRDLYLIPAPSGSGTINKITVYFRCRCSGINGGRVKGSIRSDTTKTDGSEKTFSTSWVTQSQIWATNPADAGAWEWADIDALQIGINLLSVEAALGVSSCTQVYVEVDYTPPVGLENKSANMGSKMVAAGLI